MTKIPKAYDGPDNYIVVSYCHDDSAVVVSEINKLQEKGINIWYDEGIIPGNIWRDDVLAHISNDSCIGVVFYVSDNYYLKDTFWQEATMAFVLDRKCCVVMLRKTNNIGTPNENDLYNEFRNNLENAFHTMPSKTQHALIDLFDKDRLYISISDPTRTDCLLNCYNDWQKYVPKAVFPLCNVLHNSHIEYLPSLLTATPFNFTFIAISGQKKNIAEKLNANRPQGIQWYQYTREEWLQVQGNHAPAVKNPGVIVWVDEGCLFGFCEILEKRRDIAPKVPLIINIVTENLSNADDIVSSVKRYLEEWLYLNDDIKTDDVEMNDLFVIETKKTSGCVCKDYDTIFSKKGDEPWRIVVSARELKKQLDKAMEINPSTASWLFRQLPLDGENHFGINTDIRLENDHDRLNFRTDKYKWEC